MCNLYLSSPPSSIGSPEDRSTPAVVRALGVFVRHHVVPWVDRRAGGCAFSHAIKSRVLQRAQQGTFAQASGVTVMNPDASARPHSWQVAIRSDRHRARPEL